MQVASYLRGKQLKLLYQESKGLSLSSFYRELNVSGSFCKYFQAYYRENFHLFLCFLHLSLGIRLVDPWIPRVVVILTTNVILLCHPTKRILFWNWTPLSSRFCSPQSMLLTEQALLVICRWHSDRRRLRQDSPWRSSPPIAQEARAGSCHKR